MDPTRDLIQIRNHFIDSGPTSAQLIDRLPEAYSAFPSSGPSGGPVSPSRRRLRSDIIVKSTKEVTNLPPDPRISDPEAYQNLQESKNALGDNTPEYRKARDTANPFENLGKSIFLNRASLKLANIDAVYNLTNFLGGLLNLQDDQPFTFADIAGGPGGFTQYLQWRKSSSIGFGMTLRGDLDWNDRALDLTRFIQVTGSDNSGNLYTQWETLLPVVMMNTDQGVDLLTADGGFDVESIDSADNSDVNFNYSRQEFLSSRLILIEIVLALTLVRPGGKAMIKVFDTVTSLSAEMIYLFACGFEQISLIKPISSRPANAERYLVGLRRVPDPRDAVEILTKAAKLYTSDRNVIRLISDLPEEFLSWIQRSNTLSIEEQSIAIGNVLTALLGDPLQIPGYNLPQALAAWQVPGNPLPKSVASSFRF